MWAMLSNRVSGSTGVGGRAGSSVSGSTLGSFSLRFERSEKTDMIRIPIRKPTTAKMSAGRSRLLDVSISTSLFGWGWLAVRAEIGPPLPDNGFDNRGAAGGAGLPGAAVNTKIILEIAAAVHPIDAGAVALDPFLQDTADGKPEVLEIQGG